MPRILIADSDTNIRTFYRQSFGDVGCNVVEASDGRDALVKALVRGPTLVITELHLRLIDGFALCEILRRDRVTASVPIIALTTDPQSSDIARAQRAGADIVLAKPAPFEMLLGEISCLVAQSRERVTESEEIKPKAGRLSALQRVRPQPTQVGAHRRYMTTSPPMVPPALRCPSCSRPLVYNHSYIGGVSAAHIEQWDYYECPGLCGLFQYRHGSKKLRRAG